MCEQTVDKQQRQQQQQTQTEQARALIKSKLSKQTVKRKATRRRQIAGNQMQLSLTLPHSLPRSFQPTRCAVVCVSICKQTRSPSWLRSLAHSGSHLRTAHARVPHKISQTITPSCARRCLCGLCVDCMHLALAPVLWMNSRLWVNFRFPFALFVFILAFALHLLPQFALSAHVQHTVVAAVARVTLSLTLTLIMCYALCRVAPFIVVYFLFLFVVKFNVFGGCVCATWVIRAICVERSRLKCTWACRPSSWSLFELVLLL